MRAVDDTVSLAWPSFGFAGLILIGMMIWWGAYLPLEEGPSVPRVITHLANGALALPDPYYLIPALIIGVGCGLGARNVVESVITSLPGIFIIAAIIVMAIQWQAISHLDRADTDFSMAVAITALVVSTPVFMGLIAIPMIFFSASFAILLNLFISFINPEHRNWLVDKTKIKVPEGQLFDVGAGIILVVATSWYFLGGAINLVVAGPSTAKDVLAKLDPPACVAQSVDARNRLKCT